MSGKRQRRPWLAIHLRYAHPAEARGWIGLGVYALVLVLLLMMWADKTLLKDDFFKVIATAIILTGWNNGPVGWAYQATQGGSELATRNARLVQRQAEASPPIADPDASPGAKP